MERRLEQANNLTGIITKNLQEDIKYQRMQNEKLKAELADSEKEKNSIDLDAKAQEEQGLKLREEIEQQRNNLKNAEEKLRSFQDQHSSCLRELKLLTEEAEALVKKEKDGEESKNQMSNTLEKVEQERNELIYRMNDLTEKYEQYVQAMSKEREEISQSNKKHAKMLTISMLFNILHNRLAQRLGTGMEHIQKIAKYRRVVIRRVGELIKFQEKFKARLEVGAFRKWRHGLLSWTNERRVNEVLMNKKSENKMRFKFFSEWRRKYVNSANKTDTQIRAAVRISELKNIQTQKEIRGLFSKWNKLSILLSKRDTCLERLLLKTIKRYEEDAFLTWLQLSKKKTQEIKLEKLADNVAEEKFKRQIFARLRHNIYAAEDAKIAESQVTLNIKYKEKQRNRFLKAATLAFMRLNRRKNNDLKAEGYESLKFNILDEKKSRTKSELDKEIPACAKIEEDLKASVEEHNAKRTQALLRASLFVFKRKLHYYFERWQNFGQIQTHNNLKLKKILFRWLYNKVGSAFAIWNIKVHKNKMATKKIEGKSAEKEIETLDDAIKELGKKISKQELHLKRFGLSKLKRLSHIIARKFEKKRIGQWRYATLFLKKISIGGRKITKLVRKNSLCHALDRYREQIKSIVKANGDEYKVKVMNKAVSRRCARDCLIMRKRKIRRAKQFKEAIFNIDHTISNKRIKRLLDRWRTFGHNIIRETARINNENIAQLNEKKTEEINNEEAIKQKAEETIINWTNKERNQGVAAIVKNLALWQERRVADCVRIWRKNTTRHKKMVHLLTSMVIHKGNANERRAMSSWRTFTFMNHIQQIEDELKKRVGKYDTFARSSAIKIGETEGEVKQLKETYLQLRKQNAIEEKKIEGITQVLGRLRAKCKSYGFHANFFLAWIDMFRKERALQIE